jgi:hypothetical protein
MSGFINECFCKDDGDGNMFYFNRTPRDCWGYINVGNYKLYFHHKRAASLMFYDGKNAETCHRDNSPEEFGNFLQVSLHLMKIPNDVKMELYNLIICRKKWNIYVPILEKIIARMGNIDFRIYCQKDNLKISKCLVFQANSDVINPYYACVSPTRSIIKHDENLYLVINH